MIIRDLKQSRRREWYHPCRLQNGILLLLFCVPLCLLTTSLRSQPTSDEILTRVLNHSLQRQAVPYSGLREYRLLNVRFAKEATVLVQVSFRPDVGTQYTVLERSGSTKLIEIVEKLLASEADASNPAKLAEYEFSPRNYQACLRGTERTAGRTCYVIELVPKHKSKYLIRGTAWVDRDSYAIVRLEGVTAASVSMWVGAPHIQLEFDEIDGVWLPTHTDAVSSGLFLGTSELEIRYTDYFIRDVDHQVASRDADSVQQTRP
jgi:MucB/RseB family protein